MEKELREMTAKEYKAWCDENGETRCIDNRHHGDWQIRSEVGFCGRCGCSEY